MPIKFIFPSLFALLIWAVLPAQGLKLDDPAYEQVLLQPVLGQKSGTDDNALKVDLRPFCPPVQDQGKSATCTGWAVGYAALSIESAIQRGVKGDLSRLKEDAFSALFVYNQIKDKRIEGCTALSSIEDALDLLEDKGNLKHNYFDREGCEKQPSSSDFEEAQNFKIDEYRKLFKLDANAKQKIKSVRKSLAREHPVIVGMFIKKDFYTQFGQDFYYMGPGPIAEAHAMVVVGYDDGRGREGAFLLMNSWGSSWGDNGFIWMEYEAFGELCTRAYEISLPKYKEAQEEEALTNMQPSRRKTEGKVQIKRIQIADSITYKNVNPVYQDLYYRFPNDSWRVNDIFQLVVSDITDEKYLYAFTFDAKRKVNVHFPRDKEVDEKFGERHESSIITSPNAELTLPESNVAFKLEESGEEYICLLFSSEPIKDFKSRINSLRVTSKPFPRAFALYFGDLLFKSSSILYEEEKMHYYSRRGGVDECIPILIKMNVEE